MPEYDYQCEACDHAFTRRSSIAAYKEPVEAPCPLCGQAKVQIRITSAPTMVDSVRLFGMTSKVDGSWKETLAKIHANTPGSRLKENSSVQF
jgi:putative FmdB family regulatory protein